MKIKLSMIGAAFAGALLVPLPLPAENSDSSLQQWWNGKYATGDWFGLRKKAQDHGFTASGNWKANALGVVDGGKEQRGGFDEEIHFRLRADFQKITGVSALEGLSAVGRVRWRDGDGVNRDVGAGMFDPSTFQGGKQWRLQDAYIQYVTPELFGVKKLLTLTGGWLNPQDFFVIQPDSKFFLNNSLTSSRGFSINGIPWGGSFATWGGSVRIDPIPWYYLTTGLYMSYPESTAIGNHGLAFEGYAQDPSRNGLYWLIESGFTPKIGASKLPGKYAAGFLIYNQENTSFNGQKYDNKATLYLQADQMLFRESSLAQQTPAPAAKDFGKKDVAPSASPAKLGEQGLRFFSLVNLAPDYNNLMPFYFQTGLLYEGLIPSRDKDQLGVGWAFGNYSYDSIQSERRRNRPERNYQAALEIDYRVQINEWAYVQPSFQYIIRPGGAGLIPNATVLGAQFGLTF